MHPFHFQDFSLQGCRIRRIVYFWEQQKIGSSVFGSHRPEVSFSARVGGRICWPILAHHGEDEDTEGQPDNGLEAAFMQVNFSRSKWSYPPRAPYPAAVQAVPSIRRRE